MKQIKKVFNFFLRPEALISILIIISTIAIYWQVKDYEFINFDDDVNIYENLHIQKDITLKNIKWAFTAVYWSTWQPLVWLTYMADYNLHGLDPGWHHLTNLFLHIANALLLFITLRTMTGVLFRSAFIALIFALHPIHIESVAWITERRDVLSAFFWILTTFSYVRYTRSQRLIKYIPVFFFMCFGLMAKQMLVTLPFTLLLLDFWPLGRVNDNTLKRITQKHHPGIITFLSNLQTFIRNNKHLLLEKIPLFMLSILSCFVAYYVQKTGGAVKSLSQFPIDIRLSNALISYLQYIAKMLWPFNLAVFYPHPGTLSASKTILSFLIIASCTLIAIHTLKKYSWFAVGWFWYLGTLVPVIGIIQIGSHALADRFVYIPFIGIYIILAWGIHFLLSNWNKKKLGIAILSTCFFSILIVVSWKQTSYWRNSASIFNHALNTTENNYIAHNNFGLALENQGDILNAIEHFKKSVSIKPNYVIALNNLGVALENIGKPEEAIVHYKKAIQINPKYPDPYINLAFILFHKKQYSEAIKRCYKALTINPKSLKAHIIIANSIAQKGNKKIAEHLYKKALQMNPGSPIAHNHMGSFLLEQNKIEKAISHFQSALKIDPNNLKYKVNLISVMRINKNINTQIDNVLSAIKKQPDNPDLHNKLGNLYRKRGESKKASEIFQQILSAHKDYIPAILSLASLYAENEEYEDSITYFKKAITIQPENNTFFYNIACLYAKENKTMNAILWLKKAIDMGYNNWKLIKEDKDLENIRTSPKYIELIDEYLNPEKYDD